MTHMSLVGFTVDTPALGLCLEPPPHTKTRTARGGFLVGRGVPHSIRDTVTSTSSRIFHSTSSRPFRLLHLGLQLLAVLKPH